MCCLPCGGGHMRTSFVRTSNIYILKENPVPKVQG